MPSLAAALNVRGSCGGRGKPPGDRAVTPDASGAAADDTAVAAVGARVMETTRRRTLDIAVAAGARSGNRTRSTRADENVRARLRASAVGLASDTDSSGAGSPLGASASAAHGAPLESGCR